ncbi:hypothetical protein AMS68_006309 [Peltaster fructicola]|uniref:Myb-like domain-containing protein n=1 Tax=Peltaster fructicola TaxID=286661 RepID=A0A6H0Y187_9PEZI|nr:hypothetical protein AMS68_006309 [Peltaster fructicola]
MSQASYTGSSGTSSSSHNDLPLSGEDPLVTDAHFKQESDTTHSSVYTKNGLLRYSTLKAFCEVLRQDVNDVEWQSNVEETALPASTIGASYWTHVEKDIFFHNLEIYGPTNLPAIASAIGSKSVPEVQQYLLALDDGLHQYYDNSRSRRGPSFVQTPAAADVDPDYELSLDVLAEKLEQYLHQRVCEGEKTRYGEDWIIDDARAQVIEQKINQPEPTEDSEGRPFNDGINNTTNKQHDVTTAVFPSAILLNPSSFISLSQNVFMNSNIDEAHYDKLPVTTEDSVGPSILRSAFEMFHDICNNYTKRIVHAAHFQAMTRLRSEFDARKVTAVGVTDVHKALDVMHIKRPSPISYWAAAVERYALDVYAHTKRYQHEDDYDRHIGFKLEKGEARKALTKAIASSSVQESMHADKGLSSFQIDSTDEDRRTTHDINADDSNDYDDDDDQDTPGTPIDGDEPLTDSASADLEDSSSDEYEAVREVYLESLDKVNNQIQSNLLRQLLHLPEQQITVQAVLKPRGDLQNAAHIEAWRQSTYVSDWEQYGGSPSEDAFKQTTARTRKRKR